jgi:hypothetical protein
MARFEFEFESRTILFCFSFIFVLFGESRLLASWCTCAAWCAVMRIMAGVGDLCRGLGMVTQVGYSVGGRSRGWVVLCAVCTMHVKMRSVGFLVEPQNQGRRFVSGLGSKPLGRFLIGLALKTDGDSL